MKNKYQKPAIYLTPEHTEGIYLASGAAGAAGSVTATYMGVLKESVRATLPATLFQFTATRPFPPPAHLSHTPI